uniref:Protein tyrosine phosphatase receptor type Ub n=1 Tax=Callorhinchus milii TaxID=7868 RepID=A0A4W3K7Z2_CALMI
MLSLTPVLSPSRSLSKHSGRECTFDEDAGPCDYVQGTDDDFDWELVRAHGGPHQSADLLQVTCLRVLEANAAAGDVPANSPQVNLSGDGGGGGVLGVAGAGGAGGHGGAEEGEGIFPHRMGSSVIFEAVVSAERKGYIGIDDLLILNYPCCKLPEREGDLEVGLIGLIFPRESPTSRQSGGASIPATQVTRTSPRRVLATFQLHGVTLPDQDLYRCVTQSGRGAGVSNFAELIVKEPPSPRSPPHLVRAGSTYLIVQLNTNAINGDGPVIRKEIEYQMTSGLWSEVHAVNNPTYKLWHLDPDTEYQISVLLTRPGDGGTGGAGPPLISRTKCAEPMRAPKELTFAEIKPRQITLQWEPLGYNITRCHSYLVSVCYRYLFGPGHNGTFRDCLQAGVGSSELTIKNLLPYKNIYVKIILSNPEGKKENKETIFQTDEDVPGGIPAESISGTPLEDMIFLKWEEPLEPNGVITQYEISYQSIESSDPTLRIPGPRRTLSKPRNETYHVFSNLDPGTTYLFSVRASTGKGFGQTAQTEITTNISGWPTRRGWRMELGAEQSVLISLLCCSVYQVVVEEAGLQRARRAAKTNECFPLAFTRDSAADEGSQHYYSAELQPSDLPDPTPFTVGNNNTYNGYWNAPLEPKKDYHIYLQAVSFFKGETKINCVLIAKKAACKESKRSQEAAQRSEEMGLILGICAGGLAVLILILGAIFVFVKKGKPTQMKKTVISSRHEKAQIMNAMDRSFTDQSTLQEDERHGLTFTDPHNCSTRYDQRSVMNESSSLLGSFSRSPRGRAGSPYQTGQLHPAVRVADLLQHINQMKTAEGYGFKQEYESFFEGQTSCRETSKKKENRTKTRHENIIAYDRHRVKLHPLLGDPGSDYVNASYIDGYHKANHFIATQGTRLFCCVFFWVTCYPARGRIEIARIKRGRPFSPSSLFYRAGAGRTGCYIVLDVMLDMAECEGVVDIYNCVKTLYARRINMIQTEEQYIFIHDAILEACLCGDTSIPACELKPTYKEMVKIDPQSNSSQLKEEFQTLNSVTPHLDIEECSIALLPRNREKNRSMDVLPPDRCLPFLITVDGESNNYINAALMDSYRGAATFIVTPHPLQNTTTDFWRLVYDYNCTSIIMLNQLNQLNSAWPCLEYWPEQGLQQHGPIQVELISRTADEEIVTRLLRVQNLSRLQEGQLIVRHFQYLRWSAYRDIPESRKSFLHLLKQVEKWQTESGDGRTIVHCLNGGGRSGTLCACTIIQEMIRYQKMVDVFHAVKTLRNNKPNMVESPVSGWRGGCEWWWWWGDGNGEVGLLWSSREHQLQRQDETQASAR